MSFAGTRGRPGGVLPGFGLTLGVTLAWTGLVVAVPLLALVLRPWSLGMGGVLASLADPPVLAALRLSLSAALGSAVIDLPLGLLLAWVLVRYRFPGRRLADAVIDLPFALPTAVAGISLATLYGPNGWLGAPLGLLGLRMAFNVPGIYVALVFVGLPFVVRSVQPVMLSLPKDLEEAGAVLGATRAQVAWLVVLPALRPALLAGLGMAFARAVGEYGSVIFIAGNLPMVSQIAPVVIVQRLEQFNYPGAASVAVAMLVVAFLMLGALKLLSGRVA